MLLGEGRILEFAAAVSRLDNEWARLLAVRPVRTYDELRARSARGERGARRIVTSVPPPPRCPSVPSGRILEDLGPALLVKVDRHASAPVPKCWTRRRDSAASAAAAAEFLRGKYPPDVLEAGLWRTVSYRSSLAAGTGLDPDLALEAAVRSTKLWPIVILLTGSDVTEVYGSLGSRVYLDHIEAGRLVIENLILDETDFERIKSFVELHPHGSIGPHNPLAKVDLELPGGRVRLTVDVPPASSPGFDARNLSAMSRLSLPRLISLGTISEAQAARVLEELAGGTPVLVAGPTGSGKTTLCNALLVALGRGVRVLSVEEVREVEDLGEYGMLHHAYAIPGARTSAVMALLHRNPDVVFLGEILNSEHARAFEFATDSGFRVLATTHASDWRGLLRKWSSWGLSQALEGAIVVFMRARRVEHVGTVTGGTWEEIEPGPSGAWLDLVRSLRGMRTNFEVAAAVSRVMPA